jgi:hypothetical protein
MEKGTTGNYAGMTGINKDHPGKWKHMITYLKYSSDI